MNPEIKKSRSGKRLQKMLLGVLIALTVFTSAAAPAPAHAQWAILGDVPRLAEWGGNFILTVVETMGYKLLKNTLKKVGENFAENVFADFAGGGNGQQTLFEGRNFSEQFADAVGQAGAFFVDGMATGIDLANKQTTYSQRQEDIGTENANIAGHKLPPMGAELKEKCKNEMGVLGPGICEEKGKKQYENYVAVEKEIASGCDSASPEYGACLKTARQKRFDDNTKNLETISTLKQQKAAFTTYQTANKTGGFSSGAQAIIATLCNPSLTIGLKLTLPFLAQRPAIVKPYCAWKQFSTNWMGLSKKTGLQNLINGVDNSDGWKVLRGMINPAGSEVQVALELQANFADEQARTIREQALKFQQGAIKPVTDLVGHVLTPAPIIQKMGEKGVDESTKGTLTPVLTGKIEADLLDLAMTLVDSFAGRSKDLIMKGITDRATAANFGSFDFSGGGSSGVYQGAASPSYSQQAAIKVRTARLASLEYKPVKEGLKVWAALQQDTDCGLDPNYCVIGSGFAEAIQQKMSVREAIAPENRKIDPQGNFGFDRQGKVFEDNNAFKDNFPYASLVILRKYRVIPVGWEIAALYIKDHPNACGDGVQCKLQYVIDKFDVPSSAFYRLVDPDWVLKLPAVQCNLYGFSHAIKQDGETLDGSYQKVCTSYKTVTDSVDDSTSQVCQSYDYVPMRQKVCVDERSCISEDASGKCTGGYGYCLEERAKVVFSGVQCNAEFASCLGFTERSSGQKQYLLKDSIPDISSDQNQCNFNNAGCAPYSSWQLSTSTAAIPAWSSSTPNLVYLSSVAPTCPVEQAGCTTLNGGAYEAYRIAPASLGCDGVDGYKQPQCQSYALTCNASYAGCKAYTPSNGDPKVAGTLPSACNSTCVGLTSWIEKRSAIEERLGVSPSAIFLPFVASSAQQCSAPDEGCEEFTDLQKSQTPGSGEQRLAYSKIMDCEVALATPDPKQTFYSWFGSDKQGSRIEKYQYAQEEGTTEDGTTGQPVPKCASRNDASGNRVDCTCTFDTAPTANNYDDRKGTCRQFINVNGKAVDRWTDLLVQLTSASDCREFRRTASQAMVRLSQSKSAPWSCSTTPGVAIGCHKYHSPVAANQQLILSENFDSKINENWHETTIDGTPAKISTEAETLNQASLRVAGSKVFRLLPGLLDANSTSTVEFAIKADAPTTVTTYFQFSPSSQAQGSNSISNTVFTRSTGVGSTISIAKDVWTPVKFYLHPAVSGQQRLAIEVASPGFTIDRIIVKKTDGIQFLIKDSWSTKAEQCENSDADAPKFGTVQYACQEYADKNGQRATYQGFGQLCPMQLVGCQQYTNPNLAATAEPLYLVEDQAKSCPAAMNNCTAYGMPALDAAGGVKKVNKIINGASKQVESWSTFAFKIPVSSATWSDAQYVMGVCKAAQVDCKEYSYDNGTASTQVFFHDPGLKVCYPVKRSSGEGYEFKRKTCYRGTISCQKDDDCVGIPRTGVIPKMYSLVNMPATRLTDCPANTTDGSNAVDTAVLGSTCRVEVAPKYSLSPTPALDSMQMCAGATNGGTAMAGLAVGTVCKDKVIVGLCTPVAASCSIPGMRTKRACANRSGVWTNAVTCAAYNNYLANPAKVYAVQAPTYKVFSVVEKPESGACQEKPCEDSTTPMVKSCKTEGEIVAQADTCRRITDPECGTENMPSTKPCTTNADCPSDVFAGCSTVRGNCNLKGQNALRDNYGYGSTGLSCTRDYFYTSANFSKGSCSGVDVQKGCLLFHDEAVGPASSDKYLSGGFYAGYWDKQEGRGVALNESPTVYNTSTSAIFTRKYDPQYNATGGVIPTTFDSNTVLQVKRDRECKIVLNPTDTVNDGSGHDYSIRVAPYETSASSTRTRLLPKSTRELKGMFPAPVTVSSAPDLAFMSLTGFSRPNFNFGTGAFISTSTRSGGHDGFFDWEQTVTSFKGAGTLKIATTTSDILIEPPATTKTTLTSSCRMYPEAASPAKRTKLLSSPTPLTWQPDVYNSCQYGKSDKSNTTQYTGLYGFCLEPNPKKAFDGFTANQDLTLAKYRTESSSATPYTNACLTWYPVDHIASQPTLAMGNKEGNNLLTSITDIQYYCVGEGALPGTPTPISCKNHGSYGDSIVNPNTTPPPIPNYCQQDGFKSEDTFFVRDGAMTPDPNSKITVANKDRVCTERDCGTLWSNIYQEISFFMHGGVEWSWSSMGGQLNTAQWWATKRPEILFVYDSSNLGGLGRGFTPANTTINQHMTDNGMSVENNIKYADLGVNGTITYTLGSVTSPEGYWKKSTIPDIYIDEKEQPVDRDGKYLFKNRYANDDTYVSSIDNEPLPDVDKINAFKDFYEEGSVPKYIFDKEEERCTPDGRIIGDAPSGVLRWCPDTWLKRIFPFYHPITGDDANWAYYKNVTMTNRWQGFIPGGYFVKGVNAPGATQHYTNFRKQVCGYDSLRKFIAIKPRWTINNVLEGWDWRFCGEDNLSRSRTNAALFSIHIKLDKYSAKYTRLHKEEGSYCSDIIALNGANKGVSAAFPVPTMQSSQLVATKDPPTAAYPMSGTIREYDTVEDKFCPQYPKKYDRNGTNGTNKNDCTESDPATMPLVTNSRTVSSQPHDNSSDSIQSFINGATTSYFAKPYEYLHWDGAKYDKLAYVYDSSGCPDLLPAGYTRKKPSGFSCYIGKGSDDSYINRILGPWETARKSAAAPVIQIDDSQKNRFTVGPINPATSKSEKDYSVFHDNQNEYKISFQVNVPEKQLPIRYIGVNWGDASTVPIVGPEGQDGHGKSNKDNDTTLTTFSATHTYKDVPRGQTVCVYVMDNYERQTKLCTKLDFNSNDVLQSPSDFTPPAGRLRDNQGELDPLFPIP